MLCFASRILSGELLLVAWSGVAHGIGMGAMLLAMGTYALTYRSACNGAS